MIKRIVLLLLIFTVFMSNISIAEAQDSNSEILNIQTESFTSDDLSNNGAVDFLPLLWREVKARGATPPKPFFISGVFYYMENYYNVSDATASAKIGKSSYEIDDIRIAKQTNKLLSYGFRAGVNILPFWNVYGVYVHTDGRSESKTYLRSRNLFEDNIFPGMQHRPYIVEMENKFTAETGAVGTTLSYGIPEIVGKWGVMAMFNFNAGFTKASILKDMKTTIVAALRAGVFRNFSNHMRLSMWIGADFLKMLGDSEWSEGKQTFTIPYGDPDVNPAYYGQTFNADYRARTVPNSPFGMTAGLGFSINEYVDIATEVGFLTKFSVMGAVSFNF